MKKIKILSIVLCILAVAVVFAVSAFAGEVTHGDCTVVTDASGNVTEVRNATAYALNAYNKDDASTNMYFGKYQTEIYSSSSGTYAKVKAAGDFFLKNDGALIDTGIRWDFKDGKLTIRLAEGKTDTYTYPWGQFAKVYLKDTWDNDPTFEGGYIDHLSITEIEVKSGVVCIPAYAFFCYENVTKITLPTTVKRLATYCFGREYHLSQIKVEGSEFNADGIVDLRNITSSYNGYALAGSTFSRTTFTDLHVLVSDKIKGTSGQGFAEYKESSTGATSRKTLHIYTASGGECKFGTDLIAKGTGFLFYFDDEYHVKYHSFEDAKSLITAPEDDDDEGGETAACVIEWTDSSKKTIKSVKGGVVYALYKVKSPDGIYNASYNTYTAASKGVDTMELIYAKDSSGKRIDTGLRYDYEYDSANKGTLTLYVAEDWKGSSDYFTEANTKLAEAVRYPAFPCAYMKELVTEGTESYTKYGLGSGTYNGGCFEKANVKRIVIADEKITYLPGYTFNYFDSTEEITVHNKLTGLGTYSIARCYKLNAFRVAGADLYDADAKYIVDLRNITSYNNAALSESFPKALGNNVLSFYLSEKANTSSNSMMSHTSGTSGKINFYTPNGTVGKWITEFATRVKNTYDMDVYDINVLSPDTMSLSFLGYQVRTKSYNGLRGLFAKQASGEVEVKGIKYTEDGVLVNEEFTSTGASAGGYEVIEFGTIAIADPDGKDTALDYKLVSDGEGGYVTGEPKGKVVRVWRKDVDSSMPTDFCVSIVKYDTETGANLKTNVFMTGYEIVKNTATGETKIKYTADNAATHVKPTSIFDAVIGMYRAGLINHSVEKDNVFWSVLDKCSEKLSLNDKYGLLTNTDISYGGKVTSYTYTEVGNDFKDGSNETLVSLFKTADGKYTAIVHPTRKEDGTWNTGVTFKGGYYTNKSYTRANFLSECFIGADIDTMIIDEGIISAGDGAVGCFYTGESQGTNFVSSLSTIIYPTTLKELTGQTFSYDMTLSTFIRFDAKKAKENANYVKNAYKILDMSTKDASGNYISYPTSTMFSRCRAVDTILLPKSNTQRTFSISSGGSVSASQMFAYNDANLKYVYCPEYAAYADGSKPEAGTADFRGTGLLFSSDIESGMHLTDETKKGQSLQNGTFYKTTSITKVISDDGVVSVRSTGTINSSNPYWKVSDTDVTSPIATLFGGTTVDVVKTPIRDFITESFAKTSIDYTYSGNVSVSSNSYPNESLTLRWIYNGITVNDATLHLAMREDLSDETEIDVGTATSYTIAIPYTNVTYYWWITADTTDGEKESALTTTTVADGPRPISVGGTYNVRDVGVWTNTSGKHMIEGIVYRSANLDSITDAGINTLLGLGIKTEIDLRATSEGKTQEYVTNGRGALGEGVKYVNLTPAAQYKVLKEHDAAVFTEELKMFTDIGNYPILFHCAGGNDRTATLALFLEGICGCDEKTLVADYELSSGRDRTYLGSDGVTHLFDLMMNEIIKTYPGDTIGDQIRYMVRNVYGLNEMEISNIYNILMTKSAVFVKDSQKGATPVTGGRAYNIDLREAGGIASVEVGGESVAYTFEDGVLTVMSENGIGKITFSDGEVLTFN